MLRKTDLTPSAHFPVESHSKAVFYRNLLKDQAAVVRETTQDAEGFLLGEGPLAYTAGSQRQPRRDRLATAERVAKLRSQLTGRYCLVCPAISYSFKNGKSSDKIKCGLCKACAKQEWDTIYPLH